MTEETVGEIACWIYLVVFLGYLWYIDRSNREHSKKVQQGKQG